MRLAIRIPTSPLVGKFLSSPAVRTAPFALLRAHKPHCAWLSGIGSPAPRPPLPETSGSGIEFGSRVREPLLVKTGFAIGTVVLFAALSPSLTGPNAKATN